MSAKTAPEEIRSLANRMVHLSSMALIFFSVAWAFLTIGVFTFNPTGPVGIICLCIGLLCVAISISYFIRYWLVSKKIKDLLA